MIIDINENVRIAKYELGFTIDSKRTVKDGPHAGNEVWDVVGYHGTIHSAIDSLVGRHLDLLIGSNKVDLAVLAHKFGALQQSVLSRISVSSADVVDEKQQSTTSREPFSQWIKKQL